VSLLELSFVSFVPFAFSSSLYPSPDVTLTISISSLGSTTIVGFGFGFDFSFWPVFALVFGFVCVLFFVPPTVVVFVLVFVFVFGLPNLSLVFVGEGVSVGVAVDVGVVGGVGGGDDGGAGIGVLSASPSLPIAIGRDSTDSTKLAKYSSRSTSQL